MSKGVGIMLDNENTNGFDTNPEENQTQNEQQVNDTGNTENSENKEYENTYYSQGDNSQNSYNNYNNNYSNNYNSNYNNGNYNGNYQNNGNNGDKKKKNKLPVVIAVAAVTVLVGVSCIMGIFAVANSNSKNGKSTIDSILSVGQKPVEQRRQRHWTAHCFRIRKDASGYCLCQG